MQDKDKKRIAIFGNTYQSRKAVFVREVIDTLRSYDVDIYIEEEFHNFLCHKLSFELSDIRRISKSDTTMLSALDFAVSMGGDGTFLQTASVVTPHSIPIIGINTGRLGFLADIKPTEIAGAFHSIINGNFSIEKRMMIEVEASNAVIDSPPYALNEVAVLKHDNSSTINILTKIDGKCLTNYVADGLILSSPSGSTGYSLSVGGPILTPGINAFVLSPVAPHSLNIRPIVISADSVVSMEIESRNHNYLVAIDGRNQSFSEKSKLTLRKSRFALQIVKLPNRSFYNALREKLMWGTDLRYR